MQTSTLHFLVSVLVLGLFFSSCRKKEPLPPNEAEATYSFFVAGHAYGNPNNYQLGLHPPFVNHIPFINSYPNLTTGILTGDVVFSSNKTFWDAAITDIDKFNVPIHIAPGNHDRGTYFDGLFQSYYSFMQKNDLFIILSPTDWNIEGAQEHFLRTTIENHPFANNIFIFVHELLWWSPTNKFSNIKINYAPHYPGSSNYWNDIHPFLDSLPQPVTLFAGDLGATNAVTPYMYHEESDNVTFVANGMGGIVKDNVIVVDVNSSGETNFTLYNMSTNIPYISEDITLYQLP